MAPKATTTTIPENSESRLLALEATVASLAGKVTEVAGALDSSKNETKETLSVMGSQLSQLLQLFSGGVPTVAAVGDRSAGAPASRIEEIPDNQREEVANSPGNRNQVPISPLEQNRSINNLVNQVVSSNNRPRDNWLKKLEMPVCDGSDVYGWVAKAERFFKLGEYEEPEKMGTVSVNLSGKVSKWYNWETRTVPFKDWKSFKMKLLRRFGTTKNLSLSDRLHGLKQLGSVEEFVEEFEELSSQLDHIDEESLESIFKNGLKPEIRTLVRMLKPRGLTEMIATALEMEDSVMSKLVNGALGQEGQSVKHQTYTQNKFQNSGGWKDQGVSGSNGGKQWSKTPQRGDSLGQRPRVKLSPAAYEEKKKKGECFKCDEKFYVGHKCVNKELKVLLVVNGCEVELEENGEEFCSEEELNEVNKELMELSLNSFLGISSPTTTKLRGFIGKTDIIVMLDSGATHNFMSPVVVKKTGLKPTYNNNYEVLLGTGIKVEGMGSCKGVKFVLQEVEFTADFITLELGNADIILGIQWLRTLGKCQVDWASHELSFLYQGQQITICGDPTLHSQKMSLKTLETIEQKNRGAESVTECSMMGLETVMNEIDPRIEELLQEFAQVFAEPNGLPPIRGREHAIVLQPGTGPVSVRAYRYPHCQKEEMEKMVKQMLESGVIRPSHSSFSSPVLLVRKKDNTWRFCVDYRALNRVTVSDKFPIPVIDQLLDELYGAKVFSKLDLRSGYHQIRMKEEDIGKTAFRTHDGLYEFLVMPFGLTNAPATFQSLMNELFRPYLRKFILVFFDDILVYSSSIQEHEKHLGIVLKIFVEFQLYANRKKCLFAQPQVEYLGHIISDKGVLTDPCKTVAMENWPVPKNVKGVRGFLGLTGYYRRFVRGYGAIAKPLTELLKKDRFEWNDEALAAFIALKKAMCTAPVLSLPDFTQPFIVESDASGFALGAVLMQKHNPLAYFSHVLSEREQLKPIYERELMAIVMAIQKWRHYLLGKKFIVRTDQKSLKFLLEQKEVSLEYQRWLVKLLGYDFEILYKPGIENKAADGLSGMNCMETEWRYALLALTVPSPLQIQDLMEEIEGSTMIRDLKQKVETGSVVKPGYTVAQGWLLYKGGLVIPPDSKYIPLILKEFHDGIQGGHSGVLKTQRRIQSQFYWKKMRETIQKYVAECSVCQTHKTSTLSPAGLLQPLPIPERIWEDLSMDFIEGLPTSQGVNVIFVVVDRLSKYGHFMGLKHPFNAKDVADKFIRQIVKLHGYPASIVSDRDKIFLSKFWKECFKQAGTLLKYSTAFHPQTDGQTEVLNRCLETFLRCFASAQPKKWFEYLHWAELWYNTSFHTALKSTPFQTVYGREARGGTDKSWKYQPWKCYTRRTHSKERKEIIS